MSPRKTWKGRVSSGYSGVGSSISILWYLLFLITKTREDRLSAFTRTFCLRVLLFHMQSLVMAVITLWIFNLGDTTLLSHPFCHRREFWTWTYFAASAWQIAFYSPTLACISQCRLGIILGDINICDPEEGRYNVWNQSFTDGDPGKTAVFHSFHTSLRLTPQSDNTWRDSTVIRTLSRTPRERDWSYFNNLPLAETRDFRCYSHVFENLGKQTIPSDHSAVRFVIQEPTNWEHQRKRIPSWMSKNWIFCPTLQQLHDDHRFSTDPFCALAELKVLLHKAKEDDETWPVKANTWLHRGEAFNHHWCFACLSKSTSWDAMLWSMETCWRLLWYTFLWVYWFPKTQPDFCQPCSWEPSGTWSWGLHPPLDAHRKRHCSG